MKCINRKKIGSILLCVLMALSTVACAPLRYDVPYDVKNTVARTKTLPGGGEEKAVPFASDLCVISGDVNVNAVDMSEATAAVLFDINDATAIYSKSAHERLYPASLTKVMTALVALKNASLDQTLKATENVLITESGAQLCGLKVGDTMTLEQALYVLLIYSANDAAMLIAEGVGGTPENFVAMMNEEANRLGATNTHFVNPHGLTHEEHYTTAYDLYLIMNEAIKYDKFLEIIHTDAYETTYRGSDGTTKDISVSTTNRFLKGQATAPEKVNVIGGKTGTTSAAGHCLMLLSKDTSGAPYISVILHSSQTDILYQEMADLLGEISN